MSIFLDTQALPDHKEKTLGPFAAKLHEPKVFDTILAVGLTLLAWAQILIARVAIAAVHTGSTSRSVPPGFQQESIALTLVLTALCFLPLIARRRHPVTVLFITVFAQIGCSIWTRDPILSIIGPLVAIYTVGTLLSLRKVIALTVITALLLVSTTLILPYVTKGMRGANDGGGPTFIIQQQDAGSTTISPNERGPFAFMSKPDSSDPGAQPKGFSNFAVDFFLFSRGSNFTEILQTLALVIAAAAFGYTLRTRREYVEEANRRAEEAERTKEETARRRMEEERLRIARELHDITAHSLSAVAVQAGAAEKMIATNPELAIATVEQIRTTSKSALEELRSIVAVLRSEEDPDAPLVPEASMARLSELTDAVKGAGIDVVVEGEEHLDDLPLYADMAAYRIIQESFTNTLRHAKGPAKVTLRMERTPDTFTITVTDDGGPIGDTRSDREEQSQEGRKSGHGLQGMKERAAALGGTLEAHPLSKDKGGFIVKATLPLAAGKNAHQ